MRSALVQRSSARRALFALGGLALGVGLCVLLFRALAVRPEDFETLRQGFSPCWGLAILALTAGMMASGAAKWRLLARAMHEADEPAPGFFLRHFLWQNWIGNFVPPSLAIVLGRSWAARAMPGVSFRAGAGNGLTDQAAEFALLLSLLAGSYGVLVGGRGWPGFLLFGGLGVLVLLGLPVVAPRLAPAPLRGCWLPFAGLSLLRVSLMLARLVFAAAALGLPLSALSILSLAPLVSTLALIPVTPGNLGLAEWGWTGGLAWTGIAPQTAALYALGTRLLVLVAQSVLLGLNEAYVFTRTKRSSL